MRGDPKEQPKPVDEDKLTLEEILDLAGDD